MENYSLITELGGFGVITAVLWYGVTKVMPNQLKACEQALDRQNEQFIKALEQQRGFFKEEMIAQRHHDEKMIDLVTLSCPMIQREDETDE